MGSRYSSPIFLEKKRGVMPWGCFKLCTQKWNCVMQKIIHTKLLVRSITVREETFIIKVRISLLHLVGSSFQGSIALHESASLLDQLLMFLPAWAGQCKLSRGRSMDRNGRNAQWIEAFSCGVIECRHGPIVGTAAVPGFFTRKEGGAPTTIEFFKGGQEGEELMHYVLTMLSGLGPHPPCALPLRKGIEWYERLSM